MASTTSLTSYLSSTGDVLYLTPVFVYDVTIYRIYKNRIELAYQNQKYSIKYIPLNNKVIYKRGKKCIVSMTVELYGAPKYYLELKGYKPISKEEYKELIKLKRKKK